MANTLIELQNIKKIFQVGGGFLGSGSKDLIAVNNPDVGKLQQLK